MTKKEERLVEIRGIVSEALMRIITLQTKLTCHQEIDLITNTLYDSEQKFYKGENNE